MPEPREEEEGTDDDDEEGEEDDSCAASESMRADKEGRLLCIDLRLSREERTKESPLWRDEVEATQ